MEHRLNEKGLVYDGKSQKLTAYLHGLSYHAELEIGSIHHLGWFGLVFIESGIAEAYGAPQGTKAAIVCELNTKHVSAATYTSKREAHTAFEDIAADYARYYNVPDQYATGKDAYG